MIEIQKREIEMIETEKEREMIDRFFFSIVIGSAA